MYCCKNRTASLSLLRDNKVKYKMTNQFSGIPKSLLQKRDVPSTLTSTFSKVSASLEIVV